MLSAKYFPSEQRFSLQLANFHLTVGLWDYLPSIIFHDTHITHCNPRPEPDLDNESNLLLPKKNLVQTEITCQLYDRS